MAYRTTSGAYDKVALAYEERIVPYYAGVARSLVKMARLRGGSGICLRCRRVRIDVTGIRAIRRRPRSSSAMSKKARRRWRKCFGCRSQAVGYCSLPGDRTASMTSTTSSRPLAVRSVLQRCRLPRRLSMAHQLCALALAEIPVGRSQRGKSVPRSAWTNHHSPQRDIRNRAAPEIVRAANPPPRPSPARGEGVSICGRGVST